MKNNSFIPARYTIANLSSSFASALVLVLFCLNTATSVAAVDLGLCPGSFDQGVVSTGFVECYESSNSDSQRADAEADRIALEAICLSAPNASVTSSQIFQNTSDRYFARVTCTITRSIPTGTVLCPDDSEEVYRAFRTVVCQYFGTASATFQAAQTALNAQSTACTVDFAGQVFGSNISEESVLDTSYFTTSLACGLNTVATNNIECPFGYFETSRNSSVIECEINGREFETLAEAQTASASAQSRCTDTTTGLGSVTDVQTGITSTSQFFSTVMCDVRIPSYGPFNDDQVLRACDASCTERVQQIRVCQNGGTAGGPGCIESASQIIERSCNTGTSPTSLCPLQITPSSIVTPLLLLDDDS